MSVDGIVTGKHFSKNEVLVGFFSHEFQTVSRLANKISVCAEGSIDFFSKKHFSGMASF
jgi:hypothetical protein